MLGGSTSLGLLGGGRFASCNLLVGFCWRWGMSDLLACFGRDLLGCLARFDLLDGVYLLGFAGRGSLGQVCSFRFALSGLRV